MGNYDRNWEELGKSVQEIIDRAVKSQDYQKLNQTIRQTLGYAVDKGGEAVRRAIDNAAAASEQKAKQAALQTQNKNLPVLYGSITRQTVLATVKAAGGGVLSALTLCSALFSGLINLVVPGAGPMTVQLVPALLGLGVGGWLLGSGIKVLNRMSRFKTYKSVLGEKTYCALEKLARSVGRDVGFVKKELQGMIDQGLFLEGHIDNEGQNLITSNETYRHYEQSLQQLEQRKRLEAAQQALKPNAKISAQVQEVLDKGEAFLAQIRKCNDDIPGQEISDKISRMELIVQRIFIRAKEHPEIVPDLKKLMDYYLPMTVKLLSAYADMDAQPVQGETILASKREIEGSLDTLNLAYEKLLDSVFMETALDVSTDISVLNTLLAQEGLAEDDISKSKK
ncbi:MAG: 5-bromo-4-chloroindolyl phosphate hydrolysis family protein [Oscillospiraceae bacterium]|nr:5-bromo-4-chloroindolyl phosphate hydrolysis family protein [Oscillospiraceae bacterium]